MPNDLEQPGQVIIEHRAGAMETCLCTPHPARTFRNTFVRFDRRTASLHHVLIREAPRTSNCLDMITPILHDFTSNSPPLRAAVAPAMGLA